MSSKIVRALSAVALTLAAVAAFAQTTNQNANVEEQLRSVQQQMLQAALRDDKDAFSKFLGDDLLWVMTNGEVMNKDQALSAVLPAPVRSLDVQQVQVLGQTATVVAVVHMKDGRDRRSLQEWVERDGSWKLLAHESAAIGAEESPTRRAMATAPAGTSGGTSASEARTVAPTLGSDAEREVWQAQTAIVDAYGKGDINTYSKLTADPFTRIETNGQLYDRSQWLDRVAKNRAHPLKAGAISDVQIKLDNDDKLAWATMRVVPSNPDGTPAPPERQTRIFALRNGQWQQVAAVSTPLSEQR